MKKTWMKIPADLSKLQGLEIEVGQPYAAGANPTIRGKVNGDEIITERGNDYQPNRFTHYRFED